MGVQAFEDRPPLTERVNAYDERHFVTYLRLLDADAEGADWREVVMVIFGLDPSREPERAKIVHDSHLARARWMTEVGYRHLLEPRMQ
jgi:T6SS, Transcription factor, DNA binding domain